jgi:hypothetical protein
MGVDGLIAGSEGFRRLEPSVSARWLDVSTHPGQAIVNKARENSRTCLRYAICLALAASDRARDERLRVAACSTTPGGRERAAVGGAQCCLG